uniref:Uncharacterized protein LOC114330693 n=1 Tax=Diabrotica virgifera virgifera TaxID=50390 RepID=A0A6P7FIZ8_DIAVI
MPPPLLVKTNTPCKRKKKKSKTTITEEHKLTVSSLNAVQGIYKNNSSELTLTETQFTAFLEITYGIPDPLKEALNFTSNIEGLLNDLSLLHSKSTERSFKNRITRLQKKIKRQLNPDDNDNMSASSDYQTEDETTVPISEQALPSSQFSTSQSN